MVLGIVTEGSERGLFSVADVPETTRALLAMCQSIPRWYHAEGELTPEEVAQKYAVIALNTVGCKPGRKRAR